MYHAVVNVYLMVEHIIQIKCGIIINIDEKKIIYVKKIIFEILLYVLANTVNI